MKNIYYLFNVILLLTLGNTMAQQIPGEVQNETISIIGATIHIGDGTLIENGSLVFENGKIIEVGTSLGITPRGSIINAEGKHVYPGFILPNSTLGLGEIDNVRATIDEREVGNFLPHIRSLVAYNAESKVVESMRPNGVLIAQITPQGGRISGTSSIVQLDAWNWEDAALKADDGIHINWPNSLKSKYEGFGRMVISEKEKEYEQKVQKLKDFLTNAAAYGKAPSKKENIPFAATQGILNGDQKVYIHVKRVKEIIDAVSLMQEMGIHNMTLVGAEEAYKMIDYLKSNNVSVLLKGTHSLPYNHDDAYDLPYKNAALLFKGGILVGLEKSGSGERMNGRNLPFFAGTTTGFGLNSEQALSLITFNTAKILGIDSRYGSLEKGKSATLFISEGNALDMRGNKVSNAFIDGRKISLETHQTNLWKKYMAKYSNAE
jgi:imidazolonepropionase-like amidohydrolase